MTIEVVNRSGMRLPLTRFRKVAIEVFRELRRSGRGKPRSYELGLVFITPRESARLKAKLGSSRPAGVLSFDYGGSGEIFLSPMVIKREARQRPFLAETLRLIVHGAVHIAGCHHEGSRVRSREFSQLEKKLLWRLGIAANDD